MLQLPPLVQIYLGKNLNIEQLHETLVVSEVGSMKYV